MNSTSIDSNDPPQAPRVLTIAGSDSSGGAGIEADLKVLTAHGVYGMTAITALTAQNTKGVNGIHIVPGEFLKQEIEAGLEDVGVDVVKTGMLASEENIRVVAETLSKYGIEKTVIDPVMISTSNHQLLPDSAISTYITELLPITFLLTPNIPEAKRLLSLDPSLDINTLDQCISMAKRIRDELGPKNVLVKGGHLPFKKTAVEGEKDGNGNQKYVYTAAREIGEKRVSVDVYYDGQEVTLVEVEWVDTRCTHGTGCSLASAIAANLSLGHPPLTSVRLASTFISTSLKSTTHPSTPFSTLFSHIGTGQAGPINHLHRIHHLLQLAETAAPLFPQGGFIEWLLEHPKVRNVWHEYTHHEFVERMGDGTLELDRFKFYLEQDYLFLVQFARSHSLAGYKSKKLEDIAKSASIVLHIQREMALHIGYCASFGITKEELESGVEHQACTAYTRFVLDTGHTGSYLHLQIAMLPCLLGYYDIASRLYNARTTKTTEEGNIYYKWIKNYISDDYAQAVVNGMRLVEKSVEGIGRTVLEELVDVFAVACRMEAGFWEMGLRKGGTGAIMAAK
ncbi:Phosphomethylpyrimidine kinase-domain-containing protein [Kalaharituber pfeilii]|nr:Phosphomethylpyrimidine kinase-domain-containing protein [Kalaharituber pfeilii]